MNSRLLAVSLSLSALFVASPALAFRADTRGKVRQAPDVASRDLLRVPDRTRQAFLTATSTAWAQFVDAHPGPWRVTWDDRAGTPREIIGATIPLVPSTAGSAEVERAARGFLRELRPLSGVSTDLLRTHTLTRVGDTWFVRFDRVTASGDPVDGAYAELRITKGQVVLVRLETHPGADAAPAAKLTGIEAASHAHAALAAWVPAATLRASSTTRTIEPVADGATWRYRPAYAIESVTTAGAGRWRSVVDAEDGRILARESLVHYAVAGTFTGMTEARLPGDTPTSEPMSYLQPDVGGAPSDADVNGAWSSNAATGSAVTAPLSGAFVHVANQSGANYSASFTAANATGDDFVYDAAASKGTLPEIDAYRHIVEVRAWALTVTPSLAWLSQQLTVNVNNPQTCNSFWDGSTVNLFVEDSTCNNTARIADVVYHEFGHGFHQNNLVSGVVDGAVGEGSGDYIAVTITNDHLVGPSFFKSGGAVRDVEPDKVYPTDLTGEVHDDGLIWVGAMWDLRKALITKYGQATGAHTTDLIFAKALSTGPTLDQVYDEVLLADDDDGNLANGTPNQCEIDATFGVHGLTSTSSVSGLAHTEVVGPIAAGTSIPVSVTAPSSSGSCAAATLTSVELDYTVDGQAQTPVTLSANGSTWSGTIPAVAGDGHDVRYWFVGQTAANTITAPPNAPQNSYGFYVGPVYTVWHDDFDGTSQGWTHGGTLDDWSIGTPNGQGNDPAGAYSGTKVLGNQVGGDGLYRSNANNWAESPVIDCSGCKGARLQLRRWLTVEDATYDHARILVNDQPVYANPIGAGVGGALPKDPIWSFEDYDISQLADGKNVKIRFELSADGGAEYGGWTIDDIAIVTPGQPTGGGGGKGCGCDLGGDTAVGATLLPAALAALALVIRRRRS